MESRLYQLGVFALYQLSLLLGIFLLPVALAAQKLGVPPHCTEFSTGSTRHTITRRRTRCRHSRPAVPTCRPQLPERMLLSALE